MYKGVSFGNIHSFRDLGLILSKVEIPPAKPKTKYVSVAGADGSLDLTKAHGEVFFEDRDKCKFTFSVLPSDEMTFEERQTYVSNLLNGTDFDRITLDKDPDYYYSGRVTVDDYTEKKVKIRQIIVKARVRPWKFKQAETEVSFALDSTARIVTLTNGKRAVCPTIESTGTAVVVFGGATFNLGAGTYKFLDLRLLQGANEVAISGSGTLTFRYQEADL